MHDIDRALFEGQDEGTWGEVMDEESGYSFEGEQSPFQAEDSYENDELWGETDGETDELALAAELLAVTDEGELDQFLGSLARRAVSAAKDFAGSSAGKAVGNILKSAARKALPQLGQAVGNYIVPGAGGQAGRRVGQWLGTKFESGLELEGLSPEDRDLETARAFVRFATSTAQRAAAMPKSVPAPLAAQKAATAAARQHLPGLLKSQRQSGGSANSGRWIRRGRNIVILGAR
ncbi:hypothetical protein DXK94_13390 [Arthrobacter sp. RT-1]|uniref:hypothetical protein n=1 Tax=Arthrobacter sp. RT-1 TaxID=2292263 RepID=UPI000E1F2A04|nr:hypothetical protein [Arthrobacter sp. RT-1]RDV09378.1 hypothetical protein DXK94_13390 [Arthrobacter sp. RT-1]